MIILPAIDLYEKKAVRLYKGDYGKMTVYSDDPPKLAAAFREAGAAWLHMVDLEGAKCGGTPNFDIAAKIIRTSGLSVELGGGIRDEETILRYLDAGVDRVILGTAAANNIGFVCGDGCQIRRKHRGRRRSAGRHGRGQGLDGDDGA